MKPKLKVRQVRSLSNRPHPQYRVVAGLGLRGVGSEVVVDNTPSFRGMVKKILHLVQVEEVEG
ncbi:MAG: 50S ribosomal protein L30 [Deltaproteobacteria bacterium HGW-Deltaproteobacteria-20]|nr:MAG: 50S ribosomal protein L30 [Deltaproteobacteria bacterium HGW-Deltaproteobacteria-20]